MIIDTAIVKSLFLEPFKGGGGRGGSSRRKNRDGSNPYLASVFLFFIVIYSLTFLFSFLRK